MDIKYKKKAQEREQVPRRDMFYSGISLSIIDLSMPCNQLTSRSFIHF